VCFCGWDVGAGDIKECWQGPHGIERCVGTQRLPNITSMSIRRLPAHEKATRATFFPYGAGGPEQLFSVRWKSIFLKTNPLFWSDLATGFGYLLDKFWAAVLDKVCRLWVWMCVCVCVFVCGCQTQSADGPPCWPGSTA
jgi:hypothetical protein